MYVQIFEKAPIIKWEYKYIYTQTQTCKHETFNIKIQKILCI